MNENINQIDQKDTSYLGKEKLIKLLIKFSIPCITGFLISALYNIVDQIFIGNSKLGYIGNAATGISFPVICIANAFAFSLGDGAASYLSISAGKNETSSIHKAVGTGIVTITVSNIEGTIKKTITFNVKQKVESLTFDTNIVTVQLSKNQIQLNININPSTANELNLIWSTNDSNIATVSNNGLLTLKSNSKSISSSLALSTILFALSNNFSAILQFGQVFVPNNNISESEVVLVLVTSE